MVRSQARIRPVASLVAVLSAASSIGSPLRGVVAVRLGDEDHVDVAGVVELAGAALAHRDDREPDRRGVRWELGAGDREGGLEDRVGEVGEFLGDLVHGGVAGQVAGGEVQDPAVVGGGELAAGSRDRRRLDLARGLA